MHKIYQGSGALLAVVLGALAFMSTAQAQDTGDLDDLSLEDLLSVEVVTASKNAESLSDAPGIVSTITAKEIEQFGATNLLELLERVPGVYAIGNSLFPQGMLSVRGDAATSTNNHVLVLLDGRPMRESLSGGHNTTLYTTFPLETIERIEVVRGPGSVLYGSNAYAGVINIITKQAKDDSVLNTYASYGSFNTRTMSVQGSARSGDFSVSGGAYLHQENGQGEYTALLPGEEPNTFIPEQRNVGQTFNLGEDIVSGVLSAKYKRLTLRTYAGFNKHGYYPGGFDAEGSMDFSHVTADLGYEQPVTNWWDASLNTTFTYDQLQFLGSKGTSRDVIVEATNYIRPFETANLVVGGLVYTLYGSNQGEDFMNPTTPPTMMDYVEPYNALWWSAYTQFDVRPIEKLKLIAGGQVNKVEGLALDFVPRLGAVFNATEAVGAKLLYGQAFRSPYATERTLNVPGFFEGNPDLNPEKVTSLDAQVFYNASKVQLAATYFNATQRDLIVEHTYMKPGAFWPTSTYANQGKLTIQGIELESKVVPNERLYVTGSFVYQTSEDGEGVTGTTLVPEVTAKIGASYALPAGITLGVFDTYFSAPRPLNEVDPDAFFWGESQAPDAFHYLTAKIGLNMTKLMRLQSFPTVQLDIYATNLLGGNLYISDIEKSFLSVPRQEGRSVYTALRVRL